MDNLVYGLAGAALGGAFAFALSRTSVNLIVKNGYLAIIVMAAIYLGSHLSSSEPIRQFLELGVVIGFVVLSRVTSAIWPAAIGLVIVLHGIYDLLLGASSGIADWYPAFCGGFDIVAGVAIFCIVLKKHRAREERPAEH